MISNTTEAIEFSILRKLLGTWLVLGYSISRFKPWVGYLGYFSVISVPVRIWNPYMLGTQPLGLFIKKNLLTYKIEEYRVCEKETNF